MSNLARLYPSSPFRLPVSPQWHDALKKIDIEFKKSLLEREPAEVPLKPLRRAAVLPAWQTGQPARFPSGGYAPLKSINEDSLKNIPVSAYVEEFKRHRPPLSLRAKGYLGSAFALLLQWRIADLFQRAKGKVASRSDRILARIEELHSRYDDLRKDYDKFKQDNCIANAWVPLDLLPDYRHLIEALDSQLTLLDKELNRLLQIERKVYSAQQKNVCADQTAEAKHTCWKLLFRINKAADAAQKEKPEWLGSRLILLNRRTGTWTVGKIGTASHEGLHLARHPARSTP